MKSFLFAILFSMSSTIMAASYDKLWKQVQAEADAGKPQTAYALTQEILRKAEAEGAQGQLLSAHLFAASLHQEWAPDSFFTDVAKLEALRQSAIQPEAKAIYASILAEVYTNNRQRSQASGLHMQSDELKEWTVEQYDSAASALWKASLHDIPLLLKANSDKWLPLFRQRRSSKPFHHDLLHVLWQRYRNSQTTRWGTANDERLQTGEAVAQAYRTDHNREAELLVSLDLVRLRSEQQARTSNATNDRWEEDNTIKALLALKEAFADLPLCAKVYEALMEQHKAPAAQRAAWGEEALRKYPRYEGIASILNLINELNRPYVSWSGNDIYYPSKAYTWRLSTKNATHLKVTIYRLNPAYKEEDMGNMDPAKYIAQHWTKIEEIDHSIDKHPPYEEHEDSIRWTAPSVGRYAALFSAMTDEAEAEQKAITEEHCFFSVSHLKTMARPLDDHGMEIIVVDAESGHPVKGARVNLFRTIYRQNDYRRQTVAEQSTDDEGRTRFAQLPAEDDRLFYAATQGDDQWLPEATLPFSSDMEERENEYPTVHLYSDRAIYRPGQTVHVSGVVYREHHHDASVVQNYTLDLLLRNANWKEVTTKQVSTDEMGTFSTDFILPEAGLPGLYHIVPKEHNSQIRVRVEEYKRPTFEVAMDEPPALQWPQDSITLTGQAMGYNGVPVRESRVTGTFQFTYPYFWWFRHDDSPQMTTDTVSTDTDGRFSVRIPLRDIPPTALRYGLVLSLDVDVLSLGGETRHGHLRVPLCTTPLRLAVSMDEQQDRDRIAPPQFSLLTSTGKTADGSVAWEVFATDPAQDATAKTPFAQGSKQSAKEAALAVAEALRTLPSGNYELHAVAEAGTDTASATKRFYVFGLHDKQLPQHAAKWLYVPNDTFDAKHPARIQVGTSFEDVAFYYAIVGEHGIVADSLISLTNEMRLFEIPYQERFGDGITFSYAFVKAGTLYSSRKSVKLTPPDNTLRYEWTTFRDRLHPGDHETWKLRITYPDGTPASARMMATIYDASLDALTPHHWQLSLPFHHHLRYSGWQGLDFFRNGTASRFLNFPMKWHLTEGFFFDAIDEKWLNGLAFQEYGLSSRGLKAVPVLMAKAQAKEEMSVYNAVPMADAATPKKIAGLQLREVVVETEEVTLDATKGDNGETTGKAAAYVRSNFNETAAFMPRLMTDRRGEVTLSFTLPESLTTWQLLGVAHTIDMETTDIQAQAVARKELMAQLLLPRFLRAGDHAQLRAVIQNLTDQPVSGQAQLDIYDPETEKTLSSQTATFATTATGETVLTFDYTPTEEPTVLAVRLTAKSGSFGDGEQRYLPVLPAKEWVTESIELVTDSTGTFTTDLSTLFNNNSPNATQRCLTVEYTTHPIWTVLQALPALREPQHEDVFSLASVFYANALATHIARTTPQLQKMVELWKQQQARQNGNPLTSPLAKDEELKQILLTETPWLREAERDTERMAQLIDLFDDNLQQSRLAVSIEKLCQRQQPDGGLSWFPGMSSSEVITRVVGMELTQLRTMTDQFATLPPDVAKQAERLLKSSVEYIARENARLVKQLRRMEAEGATVRTGSLMHLDYIYITQHAGVSLTEEQQKDVRYLLDHLKGTVGTMSNHERARAAIVLQAANRPQEAMTYFTSLKEHMTVTPDHGTYLDYAGGSFRPTEHKIIAHTAAMEAALTLKPTDRQLLNGMRRWLLQQKRTQLWESTICTTNAIYALLANNESALDDKSSDRLTLRYARRNVSITPSITGTTKEVIRAEEAPKAIVVERRTPSEAWGAVYAQYLSPVSEVNAQSTGLTVRREVSNLQPQMGDRLTTRYIITADRDYEYVCLRADRAACAEPSEQLSGYHYQGGLGYYRSVRDARTEYFIEHLPKGTYVLEETAYIDRAGTYTTGLTSLRCLYAPEFGSHTTAIELTIR